MIDGVAVYDDLEDYLADHADTIKQIQVEVNTNRQSLELIIVETQEYMTKSIPLLAALSKDFYSVQSEQTWVQFADMLEGLEWITNVMNLVHNSPNPFKNTVDYGLILTEIQNQIVQLDEAMRDKDYTRIADLINYEIIQSFNNLNQVIQKTIDHEVIRHDIN
jgi:hypothetical protein